MSVASASGAAGSIAGLHILAPTSNHGIIRIE
jgi:hypothetical protein